MVSAKRGALCRMSRSARFIGPLPRARPAGHETALRPHRHLRIIRYAAGDRQPPIKHSGAGSSPSSSVQTVDVRRDLVERDLDQARNRAGADMLGATG